MLDREVSCNKTVASSLLPVESDQVQLGIRRAELLNVFLTVLQCFIQAVAKFIVSLVPGNIGGHWLHSEILNNPRWMVSVVDQQLKNNNKQSIDHKT